MLGCVLSKEYIQYHTIQYHFIDPLVTISSISDSVGLCYIREIHNFHQ